MAPSLGQFAPTRLIVAVTVAVLVSAIGGHAAVREYFISADVVQWDYAPHGANVCMGSKFGDDDGVWTNQGLGSTYTKAVYQGYTDKSFKTKEKRPAEEEHLGILGPLLRAVVGDTIKIHFRNNLPFVTSMTVQGVLIEGEKEGEEPVAPGEIVTYTWQVPETAGPGPNEPSSRMWIYQSGAEVRQMHSGMVGALLVVRKGEAGEKAKPMGVDAEFVTLFQVFNENGSPFHDDNLEASGMECVEDEETGEVLCTTPEKKEGDDQDAVLSAQSISGAYVEEGNLMHAINGRVFCNLDGLNASVGDRMRWHVAVVGNEADLHTPHWHGLIFSHEGRSTDEVMLMPGGAETLDGVADNPGAWWYHCHVNDHLAAGMTAMVHIQGGQPDFSDLPGKTRTYYIAAEQAEWDYTPEGQNLCGSEAEDFGEDATVFVEEGPDRFGSKYIKAMFVEYTDDTFSTKKEPLPEEEHLGLLGPLMRAEVGDTVEIVFKNNLPDHPASMHVHGAWYTKSSEGTPYNDGTSGKDKADDAVPPGGKHTYKWVIPERSAPGPSEPSSKLWMYHSHTNEIADTYAGLVGGLVVTRRGEADDEAKPKDVDREVLLFFQVFNEGASLLYPVNVEAKWGAAAAAGNSSELAELEADGDYEESNLMHAINGYMYCNLPGLTAGPNQRVRVHVMGLGTEVDMHTPYFPTTTFELKDSNEQALGLLPGAMRTAEIVTAGEGDWVMQCNIADHIIAGMRAKLVIKEEEGSGDQAAAAATNGNRITHYIAAEEVEWDYAPRGISSCEDRLSAALGKETEDTEVAATWLNVSDVSVGRLITKALYRGYEDDNFTTMLEADPQAGMLGPLLRVAVGDTLVIVFKNNLPFGVNLVPLAGLEPANNASQAASADSVEAVEPGATVTYEWVVPEDAIHPDDVNGMSAYTYTSSVDQVAHTNAGLMGLVAVERSAGSGPSKVLQSLFMVQNENVSPFYDVNYPEEMMAAAESDPDLHEESNLKHVINGYLFCNGPEPYLPLNSTSRWLLAAMGSEPDLHSPLFEGQAVISRGAPIAAPGMMPAMTLVVDVVAQSPGRWQLRCNVEDHMMAGMRATFVVEDHNEEAEKLEEHHAQEGATAGR